MMPRLLDLFCGAGGASVGYARAGFDVVGVDIEPHPDYPYELVIGDALAVLDDRDFLAGFHVIHASPPCQAYSSATRDHGRHPDLIGPVREALARWGGVSIIENVPRSPLRDPVLLCGASFGLGATCRDGVYRPLRRHRLFECSFPVMSPGCACSGREPLGVYGGGGGPMTRGYGAYTEEARQGMGIDWMRWIDLREAIPPAYSEFLGEWALSSLRVAA